MLLSLLVAALATLVLASPLPAERAVSTNRRITWRHGDQSEEGRKNLVVCGGGPVVGFGNGNEFLISGNYFRYCSGDFRLDTGGVTTSIVVPLYRHDEGSTTPIDYCLDSTLYPGNGVKPHLWQCYPGAPQQNWVYHADGRIELAGRGLCLDVVDGDVNKGVQLWQCYSGNTNQQWDISSW